MNKIFITTVICLLGLSVFGQRSIQNTLRKYKNNEGVVSVNYKDEINKMFLKDAPELKTRIEYVDVLVFNEKGDISADDKTAIHTKLNEEKFDLLLNAKQKEGRLELYTQGPDSELSMVFANAKKDNYNVYFIMKGKIVLDELTKLGMNFQGAELLNMIPQFEKGGSATPAKSDQEIKNKP